jgi:hypothetical protein
MRNIACVFKLAELVLEEVNFTLVVVDEEGHDIMSAD